MTFEEICEVLASVPKLRIWDIDAGTLDTTIGMSRVVNGKRIYVKAKILREELTYAADPIEYIKGIMRRMRVMLGNRH